jgi:hypothetical protein
VTPQRIVVTFHTSGDKDRDKRMMRRVHGLLLSFPGDDPFEFAVYDYDDRNYQLRFPNNTTGFCPELQQTLHELLGPDAVTVLPLD